MCRLPAAIGIAKDAAFSNCDVTLAHPVRRAARTDECHVANSGPMQHIPSAWHETAADRDTQEQQPNLR